MRERAHDEARAQRRALREGPREALGGMVHAVVSVDSVLQSLFKHIFVLPSKLFPRHGDAAQGDQADGRALVDGEVEHVREQPRLVVSAVEECGEPVREALCELEADFVATITSQVRDVVVRSLRSIKRSRRDDVVLAEPDQILNRVRPGPAPLGLVHHRDGPVERVHRGPADFGVPVPEVRHDHSCESGRHGHEGLLQRRNLAELDDTP
mmetsp:Transcript_11251/g.37553  ORF Transcript_11251/g.37553 Transcript_11251/m.37553 type:complete len:210 (+) Transcript_11251:1820-2449(+)